MGLILTSDQANALDRIVAWRRAGFPGQVFKLTGLAGTGKTTMLKRVREEFRDPVITTFTGKAASVLRAKGMQSAANLHQLIYAWAGERANAKGPIYTDNGNPLSHADVVFIDEASMLNVESMNDLLKRGLPVIAVGDPGQLQPVSGESWFEDEGDAHLSEIQRQCAGSPIIQAAHLVRAGRADDALRLVPCRSAHSKPGVAAITPSEVFAHDQVLVPTNAKRVKINRFYRREIPSDVPIVGDRVICLRNSHGRGFYNGESFFVEGVGAVSEHLVDLSVVSDADEDRRYSVHCDLSAFTGDGRVEYRRGVDAFTYAYALTVHKAQGSEWPKVAVFYDPSTTDRERWLYTALTRASREITIIT